MPLYTFFLQDGPKAMPRFELEWFESRGDAKAHAQDLLDKRPHCASVAIAVGDIEIERVLRFGL